ncbi:MAG: nitroreductase family deazaflavin-dependent oxidoreductase, partial [Armatimonadetes bacterium]|nr:nitroreductase family deazaflavin-dependent oxidoreductase [Armatimonadota bacterium]NIO97815.1 nitroreductase family deazaflavin-dependent oxidoreductase [Armatimonadota bacterium]
MSLASALYRAINPIMMSLLKSPMHSLVSKNLMIITFTGRKSGKEYATPVSYFEDNGKVYCFTHSGWWRNVGEGARVRLRIRGVEYQGLAEAIPDDSD